MKLWARMKLWWGEFKLQVRILWTKGKAELALYRLERDMAEATLWIPAKSGWERGRIVRHGQKRLVVQFIDSDGIGTRSPLSVRWRNPRATGNDKPFVDPRYSGNRSPRDTAEARM